jgi:ribosomal protein S3
MGQKSTPTSLRIGLNRHFSHTWFADRLFGSLLHQQKTCQQFVQTLFKSVGIRTERSHFQQAPQSLQMHSFFCDPRIFESQHQAKLTSLITTPFFQDAAQLFNLPSNKNTESYSWFLTHHKKKWEEARKSVAFNFFLMQYQKARDTKNVALLIPLETQMSPILSDYKKTNRASGEVQFYQKHIGQILTQYTKSEVSWHPVKITSPTKTAVFIAHQAATQFEQNISFRQIFKQLVQSIKKEKSIQGFKITCAGRLGGAEMARVESKRFGQTSLHTFFQKIEYASVSAYTSYGLIGVKVWLSYKTKTRQNQ